jgi:hypothetical protein
VVWIGLIWLRIGSGGIVERVAASQEGLNSMELVIGCK